MLATNHARCGSDAHYTPRVGLMQPVGICRNRPEIWLNWPTSEADFLADVAKSLGLTGEQAKRLKVTGISRGSIIIEFEIAPDETANAGKARHGPDRARIDLTWPKSRPLRANRPLTCSQHGPVCVAGTDSEPTADPATLLDTLMAELQDPESELRHGASPPVPYLHRSPLTVTCLREGPSQASATLSAVPRHLPPPSSPWPSP